MRPRILVWTGTSEMWTDYYRPSVFTDAEQGIYATSDMIEFHPTRKGFFKVVGRVDDQIMLSTGEKTNPGPLCASWSFSKKRWSELHSQRAHRSLAPRD